MCPREERWWWGRAPEKAGGLGAVGSALSRRGRHRSSWGAEAPPSAEWKARSLWGRGQRGSEFEVWKGVLGTREEQGLHHLAVGPPESTGRCAGWADPTELGLQHGVEGKARRHHGVPREDASSVHVRRTWVRK